MPIRKNRKIISTDKVRELVRGELHSASSTEALVGKVIDRLRSAGHAVPVKSFQNINCRRMLVLRKRISSCITKEMRENSASVRTIAQVLPHTPEGPHAVVDVSRPQSEELETAASTTAAAPTDTKATRDMETPHSLEATDAYDVGPTTGNDSDSSENYEPTWRFGARHRYLQRIDSSPSAESTPACSPTSWLPASDAGRDDDGDAASTPTKCPTHSPAASCLGKEHGASPDLPSIIGTETTANSPVHNAIEYVSPPRTPSCESTATPLPVDNALAGETGRELSTARGTAHSREEPDRQSGADEFAGECAATARAQATNAIKSSSPIPRLCSPLTSSPESLSNGETQHGRTVSAPKRWLVVESLESEDEEEEIHQETTRKRCKKGVATNAIKSSSPIPRLCSPLTSSPESLSNGETQHGRTVSAPKRRLVVESLESEDEEEEIHQETTRKRCKKGVATNAIKSSSPIPRLCSPLTSSPESLSNGETQHGRTVSAPKRRLVVESLESEDEEEEIHQETARKRCKKGVATFDLNKSTFLLSYKTELTQYVDDYRRRETVKAVLIENGHLCNLRFKRKNVHRLGNSFVEYAHCKFEGCRNYRIDYLMGKGQGEMVCSIRYCGPADLEHCGPAKVYPLKGEERKSIKERLLRTKPSVIQDEHVQQADEDVIAAGNMQCVRSSDVYRKARSEALADGDFSRDPILDVVLRAQSGEEKGYIQHPTGKTLIKMYSKEQCLGLLSSKTQVVLHFDSTGSLVKKGPYDVKRVYYYAAVVLQNGKICPLVEMVSSSHDSATIAGLFIDFRYFLQSSKLPDNPFSEIVIDCSLAMIAGVASGWLVMKPSAYLKICFDALQNGTPFNEPRIRLCCSHFMHMVSRRLRKIEANSNKRKFYCSSIAAMIECRDWFDFVQLFIAMAVISLGKYSTGVVVQALAYISGKHEDVQDQNDEEVPPTQPVFSKDDLSDKLISGSPFTLHFQQILAKVEEVVESADGTRGDGTKKNELHCPEFLSYMMRYHMAFAPLWSGLMVPDDHQGRCRKSNAPVECWFKIAKQDVHQGNCQMRPGRFIGPIRKKIMATLKTLRVKSSFPKINRRNKLGSSEKKRSSQVRRKVNTATARKRLFGIRTPSRVRPQPTLRRTTPKKRLFGLRTPSQEDIDSLTREEFWLRKTPSQRPGYFDSGFTATVFKECEKKMTEREDVLAEPLPNAPSQVCGPGTEFLQSVFVPDEAYPSQEAVCDAYMYAAHKKPPFQLASFFRVSFPDEPQRLSSRDFATMVTLDQMTRFNLKKACPRTCTPITWVSDDVLDFFGWEIFENHRTYAYIDSLAIQTKDFNVINEVLKTKIAVFAKLFDHHWLTIAVDSKQRTVFVFNSTPANMTKTVKRWMSDKRSWKFIQLQDVFTQSDSHSCGIATIFFMYRLSLTTCVENCSASNLDPESFRLVLQSYIVNGARSRCSSDLCTTCFLPSPVPRNSNQPTPTIDWVDCDNCRTWFHCSCSGKPPSCRNLVCFICESKEEIASLAKA
ncbi:short chain dehydrogenase [Nesidiocoris tenuis]|uniref:Short chain dehydrogenase n=1 Tax=Nesidiocoris tenuis TaxID=355587 RepID=A0ABN7B140_9HEMI|nr:short chain dehydrogenase [Nesidiocoris tenuis]